MLMPLRFLDLMRGTIVPSRRIRLQVLVPMEHDSFRSPERGANGGRRSMTTRRGNCSRVDAVLWIPSGRLVGPRIWTPDGEITT